MISPTVTLTAWLVASVVYLPSFASLPLSASSSTAKASKVFLSLAISSAPPQALEDTIVPLPITVPVSTIVASFFTVGLLIACTAILAALKLLLLVPLPRLRLVVEASSPSKIRRPPPTATTSTLCPELSMLVLLTALIDKGEVSLSSLTASLARKLLPLMVTTLLPLCLRYPVVSI